MTCTYISVASLNPGRMNDLLELFEEVRQVLQRTGGRNYRLYRVSIGGPHTGLLYSGVDFDNVDSFGRAYDQWLADTDFALLLDRVWGQGGAVIPQSAALLVQIGDFGATDRPSQPGVAVDLAYWKVTPDRFDEALQATINIAEYFKPFGGRARVYRLQMAGEQTGLYVVANEFPSMEALGEWQMTFGSHPDLRQIVAAWDADPPAIRVSSVVSTRLV